MVPIQLGLLHLILFASQSIGELPSSSQLNSGAWQHNAHVFAPINVV